MTIRNTTSLSDFMATAKPVYRKWNVGDKVQVIGEGVGVIVAKFDKRDTHGHKTYDVELQSRVRCGNCELTRKVHVGACQLRKTHDMLKCAICNTEFAAYGKKKTCCSKCAEEYARRSVLARYHAKKADR